MSERSLRWALVAGLVATLSCSHSSERRVDERAALGGKIAARVGADAIPLELVAQVSADQKIEPREAMKRLVDDAIAASAARERGFDRNEPASWLSKAAKARILTERITREARDRGPPTDEEIKALSERHWRVVDRPPAVHATHALARAAPKGGKAGAAEAPGEAASAKARKVAEAIRDAVKGAKTADEFRDKANAVAHEQDIQVLVEMLPAFAADGRITEGPGQMVPPFAKAISELREAGDQTGIVETEFGWHVAMLLDRVPEQRMPFETRRAAFAEEVVAQRARTALDAILAAQSASGPSSISPAAEPLMRSVTETVLRESSQ